MRTYRMKFKDGVALHVDAYAATFDGTWRTSVDGVGFVTVDDFVVHALEGDMEADENVEWYEDITDNTDREIILSNGGED